MVNWEKIRKEWETSSITLKALAEKHGVRLGTLKSRKFREKWSRDPTKKDATNKKDATPKNEKVATEKIVETVIENDKLNDAEKEFCLQYIKYYNATKAYQKVYGGNYSSCRTLGSRMLTKVHIKNEIKRLQKQQAESLLLDSNAVLQKYIDIAFSDITDFVEFGQKEITVINEMTGEEETITVNHVDFKNSSDVDGTIITEVKKGKDGVSVKLADKMKALDFLSEYTKALTNTVKEELEIRKMLLDIEKAKAEIDNLQENEDDSPIEILIKRKGED